MPPNHPSKFFVVTADNTVPCDRRASSPLPFPGKAAVAAKRAAQQKTATAHVLSHVRAASRELRALRPLPAELRGDIRAPIAGRIEIILASLEKIDDQLSGNVEADASDADE